MVVIYEYMSKLAFMMLMLMVNIFVVAKSHLAHYGRQRRTDGL